MTETVAKPNKREKFLRVPYALRGIKISANGRTRRLNRSELKAVSAVFSFTSKQNGSNFTYSEFAARYHASSVTVGRAIRSALGAKLVERKNGAHNYELTDAVKQRIDDSAVKKNDAAEPQPPFLKIEDWIYHAEFNGRYLKQSEIEVLFYLCSRTEEGKICFKATDRYISRGLQCSPTTVGTALDTLVEIGLVTIVGRKARNGHTRTTYTLNDNLMRNKRNAVLRPRSKGKSAAVKAADAQSEREWYYAEARARAERRAAFMNEEARADERYANAETEIRTLEPKLAKAIFQNLPERDEIYKRLKRAKMIRAERLTALNLIEEDLLPRWKCRACSDTGFLPNGRPCGCYPQGGKRP